MYVRLFTHEAVICILVLLVRLLLVIRNITINRQNQDGHGIGKEVRHGFLSNHGKVMLY